ncbi:hypothetical protein WN51_00849 [Melipona quadrifasciata]|uniref:Uncharacterized protein n=1 Tax=Melipona quadrifasciata TaxID=166423 RepID=A0A0N0BKQ5_9HYME|nr:hypothetical protein WN51_00849 [Melipona quadrifasciata]
MRDFTETSEIKFREKAKVSVVFGSIKGSQIPEPVLCRAKPLGPKQHCCATSTGGLDVCSVGGVDLSDFTDIEQLGPFVEQSDQEDETLYNNDGRKKSKNFSREENFFKLKLIVLHNRDNLGLVHVIV